MPRPLQTFILGFLGTFLIITGCSAIFTKQVIKSLIDVALAACIAEHPEADTLPALKTMCEVTSEAEPYVDEILAARKRGLKRMTLRDAGF